MSAEDVITAPLDTGQTDPEPSVADGEKKGIGGPGLRGRIWRIVAWFGTRNSTTVFVLSLLSGLILSSILIVATTPALRTAWGGLFTHPWNAISTTFTTLRDDYWAMLKGAIGDPKAFQHALDNPSSVTWGRAFNPIGSTITASVPLAIAGVGLAIAYRAGAFSIGATSQIILGGMGASWVGFSFAGMPWLPHVLFALLAAAAGGALGGLIPGILKATTGASEVIVTIMLNYVLANFLTYVLSSTFFKLPGRGVDNPIGRTTVPSAALTNFSKTFPVNSGVIVAVLVVIFGSLLMNRSRLGFAFQIAGTSPRAARVAGIRQTALFVLAFVVSGAVVGLAGGVQVLGVTHQLTTGFGGDIGGLAILVAFVGNVKPLGIGLAALLYGALQTGGLNMQLNSGVSYQLTSVMQALIVMFVTAPAWIAGIYRLRTSTSEEA